MEDKHYRHFALIIILIALVFTLKACDFRDEADTVPWVGNVNIVVTEANTGDYLEGATVFLDELEEETDFNGSVTFKNIEEGEYELNAIKEGWTARAEDVEMNFIDEDNNDFTIEMEAEEAKIYTLEADIEEGEGVIKVDGNIKDLPFENNYEEGREVELEASPAESYEFEKWIVDGQNIFSVETTITMDADVEARVYFEFDLEEPEVTTIDVEGPGSITIPDEGETTAQYSATVKDQQGNEMPEEEVTWSLEDEETGISIDDEGIVTVTSQAEAGFMSVVATSATDPAVSGKRNVTLIEPDTAFFAVDIDEAASDLSTEESEDFSIVVDVENTGDQQDTQDIAAVVDGDERASESVTLTGGESQLVTLTFEAKTADDGETVTVSSDDDEATTTITILKEEIDSEIEIIAIERVDEWEGLDMAAYELEFEVVDLPPEKEVDYITLTVENEPLRIIEAESSKTSRTEEVKTLDNDSFTVRIDDVGEVLAIEFDTNIDNDDLEIRAYDAEDSLPAARIVELPEME